MEHIIWSWVILNSNTEVCQWRRRLTKSSFNLFWLVAGESFHYDSKVLHHWWRRKWRGCLPRFHFQWPAYNSKVLQKYFTGGGRNEEDVSQGFTFIGQLDQHCLGFSGWLDSFPPRPSRLPLHIQPTLSAVYKVRSFVCYRTQVRSDHVSDWLTH